MEINESAASQFSIRTSDRRTFRRCMRKWDFQSSLRQNLTRDGAEQNINFWFGSAIHFCMEDYHGYNKFKDPRRALYAYYNAFPEEDKPVGASVNYDLGISMLTYYMQWMKRHNENTGFETLWLNPETYEPLDPSDPNAVPGVEISFYIPLHIYALVEVESDKILRTFKFDGNTGLAKMACIVANDLPSDWDPDAPEKEFFMDIDGYDTRVQIKQIYYHGTIDRIVKDRYGRYWLWDYKTAKSADTAKLATDDQVSAYLWAAKKIFPFPVYGFVYLQMTKDRVQPPKRLKDGTLSVDKKQRTTYSALRQAIIEDYGDVNQAPSKLVQFLNTLAEQETPEGDRFIRWDFVKRNEAQLEATERNIYGELSVMLNPNLTPYPSPTRDCSWDCPFREACIFMDQDDTYAYNEFMESFVRRPHVEDGNKDAWRDGIAWPREGAEGESDLVPMDEVLDFDRPLVPILEDVPEDTFQFYYEDD